MRRAILASAVLIGLSAAGAMLASPRSATGRVATTQLFFSGKGTEKYLTMNPEVPDQAKKGVASIELTLDGSQVVSATYSFTPSSGGLGGGFPLSGNMGNGRVGLLSGDGSTYGTIISGTVTGKAPRRVFKGTGLGTAPGGNSEYKFRLVEAAGEED